MTFFYAWDPATNQDRLSVPAQELITVSIYGESRSLGCSNFRLAKRLLHLRAIKVAEAG